MRAGAAFPCGALVLWYLAPRGGAGRVVYGYFPMSSSVVLQPARTHLPGFTDGLRTAPASHPVLQPVCAAVVPTVLHARV
jgi:hypothetical protein